MWLYICLVGMILGGVKNAIHGKKRKLSAWLKGDNRLSGVVGDLVDDKPRYTPHPED